MSKRKTNTRKSQKDTQLILAGIENLYQSSQKIAGATNLTEMVEAVVNAIADVVINRAVLLGFESENDQDVQNLTVLANWHDGQGVKPSAVGTSYPVEGFIPPEIIGSSDPRFYHNGQDDEAIDLAILHSWKGFNAAMTVTLPLVVDTNPGALLILQSTEDYQFTDHQKQLYTVIANQMAAALQNKQLLQKNQTLLAARDLQAQRLASLNKMSRALSEVNTEEEIHKIATREISQILNSDRSSVILLDESGENFTVLTGHGDIKIAKPGDSRSVQGSFPGIAVSQKKVVVSSVEASETNGNISSVMSAPLLVEGRPIGTLNVGTKAVEGYTSLEESILEQMAVILSVAIENRRFFDRNQATSVETEALYEVSRAVSTTSEVQAAMDALMTALLEKHLVSDVANAAISVFDLDVDGTPEWSEVVSVWTPDDTELEIVGERTYLPETPLTGLWADDMSKILVINDIENTPQLSEDARQQWLQQGIYALALMPLHIGSRWIGQFCLTWKQPVTFTARDERLYQAVLGPLASIVDNQRLFDETRHLASIVEHHPDFIGIGTLDGQMIYLNPAGFRMMGLRADQNVTTMTASDFYTPSDADRMVNEALPTALKVGFWFGEMDVIKGNGSKIPVEVMISINYSTNEDKSAQSFIITMRDITTRQKTAESLAEALTETQILYQTNRTLANASTLEDGMAGVLAVLNQHDLAQGLSEATLNKIETNDLGEPEWAEVVADWVPGSHALVTVGEKYYLPESPFAKIWTQNPAMPVLISNVETDDRLADDVREAFQKVNVQAIVLMPLHISGRWVGQFNIRWSEAQVFTNKDEQIYRALMRQISAFVDNQMLFARIQQSLTTTEKLYKAGRRINEAGDNLQEIIAAVAEDGPVPFIDRALLIIFDNVSGGDSTNYTVMANWPNDERLHSAPVGSQYTSDLFNATDILFTREASAFDDVWYNDDIHPIAKMALKERNVRALVVVPLWSGQRQLGVMLIESQQAYNFKDNEVESYLSLARQVAVAFENIRLLDQSQKSLAETQILYEISGQLSIADSFDEILQVAISPAIGATTAHLFSVDVGENGEPEWIELKADWNPAGSSALELGARVYVPESRLPNFWVDYPEMPTLVSDVLKDARIKMEEKALYQELGAQAKAILPLRLGGTWVGVLAIYWPRVQEFTEADRRIYQSVASQTSVVMNNLLLLQQAQTSLTRSEKLYQASRRINESTDMYEAVAAMAEVDSGVIFNRANLMLLEQDIRGMMAFRVVANWYSGSGSPPSEVGTHYPLNEYPSMKRFLTREPVTVDDIRQDEALAEGDRAVIEKLNIRAIMAFPLWSGSQQLGLLMFEAEEPQRFTLRQIQPYIALSSQVAVALENQRLLAETQTALAEVENIQRRYTVQAWKDYHARNIQLFEKFKAEDSGMIDNHMYSKIIEALQEKRALMVGSNGSENGHNGKQVIVDHDKDSVKSVGMVMPLTLRGEVLGVLGVQEEDKEAWLPEELSVIEAISKQIALTAESLRLVDETQQKAAREAQVNEISEKIQAAQSIEEALQIAVKEVGLSLKAPQTTIRLDVEK